MSAGKFVLVVELDAVLDSAIWTDDLEETVRAVTTAVLAALPDVPSLQRPRCHVAISESAEAVLAVFERPT